MAEPRFNGASAYSGDVCELPVASIDAAAAWYRDHFAMVEIERTDSPVATVVLERDGVRLGFAENGGDSSQNGAVIAVDNIEAIRAELEGRGVTVANSRVDERDGEAYNVFFVVAPDGLCYYFNEPVSPS